MSSPESITTEVVVDFDGQLFSGSSLEDFDFTCPPAIGSEYFRKRLYKVARIVGTIGNTRSAKGSLLMDLLETIYKKPGAASDAESQIEISDLIRRIKPIKDKIANQAVIAGSSSLILRTARRERLLYIKLVAEES